MAYSDGMDSQAVAALEGKKLNGRVVRVRIGTSERDISRQERKEMPFHAVPYKVKIAKKDGESSARSRGFKFSLISAMAGYLIDVPVAIVPESGQGALAPVLLPVGHGYEDYRNHPAFTAQMERFVYSLLGYRFKYQFPRLWMTKGETLKEFVDNCEGGSKWHKTRSCWQTSRQIGFNGTRRQCGICAACILRRLSVHAAGLKEATDVYVWESLRTKTWEAGAAKNFDLFTNALHQYSVAGVLHFEHLAGLQGRSDYQLTSRLSNFELAQSLGESPVSVSQKLDRLLRQHAKEWSAFTKDLGPRSFVRQWIRSSAS
ncbi:MAG: 7-cyano-7-deazaguanine synthase [Aquabacterium sp.]|uniref:7-cyano-7-deazaguanine synthase n=1 Tax=Aquabacterium sp. TaxID=1872578 RepID=UPI00271D05BD|nr:7-cyano-7-deazaguanine synthase [Aquabacterium sp.]MDO9001884.1 7-cyano-7-deazaguanine synthase [Aquabacterium sp.]